MCIMNIHFCLLFGLKNKIQNWETKSDKTDMYKRHAQKTKSQMFNIKAIFII